MANSMIRPRVTTHSFQLQPDPDQYVGDRAPSRQGGQPRSTVQSAPSSKLQDKDGMASGYDYREVQSAAQEIRVLRIDPACRTNEGATLRGVLEHISLANEPARRFVAISYHWGTSRRRVRFIIDGQTATIPKTAADAIRNLSKVTSQPLWIDALCINQQNLQEKSEQVAMMKQVYSKAVSVLIWLGAAQKSTPAAIASIEKIYEQCLEVTDGLEHLHHHLYGTDGSPGFKYSDAPLPRCDWSALRTFYSYPWFGRLWVIQEIGLARGSKMCTTSHAVNAEKVILAARWMVHRKYARHYHGQETLGIESASDMYRPAGRPLWNQLRRTHRAACSKPQDKVYGLLGLLREETALAITASYTRPLVEVYAQAIRVALYEAGDLTFLQFAAWFKSPVSHTTWINRLIRWLSCHRLLSRLSDDSHWPSWVLKLHGETSDQSGACRNVPVFGRSSMTACFGLQTRILDAGLMLKLKGVPVDTITWVGPVFTAHLFKNSARLAEVVIRCVRYAHKESPPDEHFDMKDLALCLTCGSNKANLDAELGEGHAHAFEEFLRQCQQHLKTRERGTSQMRKHLQRGPLDDAVPAFFHDLWSKATNRRFYVTSTGMIGMGPSAAHVADHVCLLYGSEVPFLLRPSGHYFELIGDTYVRTKGRSCNGRLWSELMEKGTSDSTSMAAGLDSGLARTMSSDRWFEII
jgi:hypothetical protein